MKTLTKITLLGAAVSVILHLYLAFHYYPIRFGSSGPSICSINATFDCDAVSASSFSAFLDVPLALWGAATNLVIFILALGQWWGWSDDPERLRRWTLVLIGLSAFASATMGVVSTQLHNYCLFCITLYVLSFIMLGCYARTLQAPFFGNLGSDLAGMWPRSKGVLIAFAAIPALAFLGHAGFKESFGIGDIDQKIEGFVADWQRAPQNDFVVPPAITMGPERSSARMTLSEFADFRCPHCRHAYPSLDHFAKSHPNVRLEFYNFPLDGKCNEALQGGGGDGISCRLAVAVTCAAKQDDKGWDLHHAIYDAQDEVLNYRSMSDVDQKLTTLAGATGVNRDALFKCMDDQSAQDAVRMQAKQGAQVKIEGTPTIFANGKLLPAAQLIPVLEAALKAAK